jgi:hypothetical protein
MDCDAGGFFICIYVLIIEKKIMNKNTFKLLITFLFENNVDKIDLVVFCKGFDGPNPDPTATYIE